MGKYAGGSSGRYAGTIRQRLQDLQGAMDDPKVKAILCSRGGYGAVHLVDKIDFTAFREHPKWLLGFSDITALHNLFQKNGYASLHSLMARHLTVEPEEDPCVAYLKDILFGNLPVYTCEKHKLNRQGTAEGILRGGNMAVAYGLRGTPYDIPAEGTILFLEDVSERPHAIERMMYNPAQILPAFLIGILFAWTYYKTASLIPCILMHILNNSLSVFLSTKYPEAENMSDLMNTSSYLITIFVAVLILAGVIWAMRRTTVRYPWKEETNITD
jgi:hypothetical protein